MSYCGQNEMPSNPQPSDTAFDSFLAALRTPAIAADLANRSEVWTEIKRLAELHRLSGVLAHSTSAWLPAAERAWRDRVLMTHHRRHQLFLRQLQTILGAFEAARISCVVVKGPILAERVHAVPFLKFSHDLDLLVRSADIPEAARVMESLGFRLRGKFPGRLQQRYLHDLEFTGDGEVRFIEVHYALNAGSQLIRAEELLGRAVPWQMAGSFNCLVLSPADECLYLVVHAAIHGFLRLRWLYDALAAAKTMSPEDRAQVRSLALEKGLTGYLIASDMGCQEFFGEPLGLDLTGFSRPWLWSALETRHISSMARREGARVGTHALDLCRMSGTPASALRFLLLHHCPEVLATIYRSRSEAKRPDS